MALEGVAVKEKLQEYALLAEIISSIAILATLIILVLEMRENTEAVQSATIQSLAERTQQFTLEMASNPELALVSASFFDPDFSGGGEYLSAQQVAYLATVIKLGEESYIQFRDGLLSEEFWLTRASFVKGQLRSDLARSMWVTFNKENFIPEYVEWLSNELEKE